MWHDVLPCSLLLYFLATYFPVTQTWNLTFLTSYLPELAEFHWVVFFDHWGGFGLLPSGQEFHNQMVSQCVFWMVLICLHLAPTPAVILIFPTLLPNTPPYNILHPAASQIKCKPFSLTGKHLCALIHLPSSFSLTSSQTFQPGQTQLPRFIYFCL